MRSFSLPARFVHGSFLIAVLVLNYAYGGVLVSMITAPTLQFTVKSIEDVAANKEIRPLIINESNTQTEFEVIFKINCKTMSFRCFEIID